MVVGLESIFESIRPPAGENSTAAVYSVLPIPGFENYLLGKDRESHACFLVDTADGTARPQPPIRLESLDAQFALRCQLRKGDIPDREGRFTVVRCRSLEPQTIRYFLSVCETVLRIIGDYPQQRAIASTVHRLAAILQKIRKPPTRPVLGLFGELFLVSRSGNPAKALEAWRTDEAARFDFTDGDVRLDVKTTSGRTRAHSFSYDQCNPPPNTFAVVASMFVERVASGLTLGDLCEEIEASISRHPDLVFKLHEVLATTLGNSIAESLEIGFDEKLAHSSLTFFDLRLVPAIRGQLPEGVSDVHFRADLSALSDLSVSELIDKEPLFWDLLPRFDEQ